jgi:uncharacterized protein (TIGR02145 family)
MKKIALSLFGLLFLLAFVACKKDKPAAETVTDIDGNVYKTVKIGTQTWMAENLKTTRLNDGTAISYVPQNAQWVNVNGPAYCWLYDDLTYYNSPYGALYSFYTVASGKLAPKGWHIPTQAEWETLIAACNNDAGKLKITGDEFWPAGNTATNSTKFGAVGTGWRIRTDGSFQYVNEECNYWSSTVDPISPDVNSMVFQLNGTNTSDILNFGQDNGLSVRCVKD